MGNCTWRPRAKLPCGCAQASSAGRLSESDQPLIACNSPIPDKLPNSQKYCACFPCCKAKASASAPQGTDGGNRARTTSIEQQDVVVVEVDLESAIEHQDYTHILTKKPPTVSNAKIDTRKIASTRDGSNKVLLEVKSAQDALKTSTQSTSTSSLVEGATQSTTPIRNVGRGKQYLDRVALIERPRLGGYPPSFERSYVVHLSSVPDEIRTMSEADARQLFTELKIDRTTKMQILVFPYRVASAVVTIADCFPDEGSEFLTPPQLPRGSPKMFLFVDQLGRKNGPFTNEQMREWFDMGKFDGSTRVMDSVSKQWMSLKEMIDSVSDPSLGLFEPEYVPPHLRIAEGPDTQTCFVCGAVNQPTARRCAVCESDLHE